jgi:hypothetical protein
MGSFGSLFAAPEGWENNWIETLPDKAWFAYFRFYGPEQPYFDLSWKLPGGGKACLYGRHWGAKRSFKRRDEYDWNGSEAVNRLADIAANANRSAFPYLGEELAVRLGSCAGTGSNIGCSQRVNCEIRN